ncbi:MAG: hypothetical protein V1809_00110 [Planctomycetota bacterium]
MNISYSVVFATTRQGGLFTVSIPALPGLVFDAHSVEEGLGLAEEAIHTYLKTVFEAREPHVEEMDCFIRKIEVDAFPENF